jgi:phenylpropionate dioxygenase-like ring-hydroxylating dioxygenase large terminal subunit
MANSKGSGYGRIGVVPAEAAELTHVGPGTPMGELMRRYWQPVVMSSEIADLPKYVHIMGEELVVFRDGRGRPGLLDRHCCHRGTSLEYARIEEDGIRCCYHGWKYDVEGNCLDQPGEPAGSNFKHKVHQPWYPVEERYGLVFAYMGPPDKQPLLPYYDILEADGVELFTYRNFSRGVVVACNWLQLQENAADPVHTFVLHAWNPGLFKFSEAYSAESTFDYECTETSVIYTRNAALPNGNRFIRNSQIFVATARSVPPIILEGKEAEKETERSRMIGWWVPVDDTHTIGFHVEVVDADHPRFQPSEAPPPRPYEETQRAPDDLEAQVSQRPIAVHALEHLGHSDTGVLMFRRLLSQAIAAVEKGKDPPGIARDPANRVVSPASRNQVLPPEAAE